MRSSLINSLMKLAVLPADYSEWTPAQIKADLQAELKNINAGRKSMYNRAGDQFNPFTGARLTNEAPILGFDIHGMPTSDASEVAGTYGYEKFHKNNIQGGQVQAGQRASQAEQDSLKRLQQQAVAREASRNASTAAQPIAAAAQQKAIAAGPAPEAASPAAQRKRIGPVGSLGASDTLVSSGPRTAVDSITGVRSSELIPSGPRSVDVPLDSLQRPSIPAGGTTPQGTLLSQAAAAPAAAGPRSVDVPLSSLQRPSIAASGNSSPAAFAPTMQSMQAVGPRSVDVPLDSLQRPSIPAGPRSVDVPLDSLQAPSIPSGPANSNVGAGPQSAVPSGPANSNVGAPSIPATEAAGPLRPPPTQAGIPATARSETVRAAPLTVPPTQAGIPATQVPGTQIPATAQPGTVQAAPLTVPPTQIPATAPRTQLPSTQAGIPATQLPPTEAPAGTVARGPSAQALRKEAPTGMIPASPALPPEKDPNVLFVDQGKGDKVPSRRAPVAAPQRTANNTLMGTSDEVLRAGMKPEAPPSVHVPDAVTKRAPATVPQAPASAALHAIPAAAPAAAIPAAAAPVSAAAPIVQRQGPKRVGSLVGNGANRVGRSIASGAKALPGKAGTLGRVLTAVGGLGAAGLGAGAVTSLLSEKKKRQQQVAPLTEPLIVPALAKVSSFMKEAVTEEEAQGALDRLDRLDSIKPTAQQVARYGMIGAVATPSINALGNAIKGKPLFDRGPGKMGLVRSIASDAAKGAIGLGLVPVIRHQADRSAERKTLTRFIEDDSDKLAFQTSMYSGPLSYGGFEMVSSIPAFRRPSLTSPIAAIAKEAGVATTPAGVLARSKAVGKTPGSATNFGPSISQLSPSGGRPIAGAIKPSSGV